MGWDKKKCVGVAIIYLRNTIRCPVELEIKENYTILHLSLPNIGFGIAIIRVKRGVY